MGETIITTETIYLERSVPSGCEVPPLALTAYHDAHDRAMKAMQAISARYTRLGVVRPKRLTPNAGEYDLSSLSLAGHRPQIWCGQIRWPHDRDVVNRNQGLVPLFFIAREGLVDADNVLRLTKNMIEFAVTCEAANSMDAEAVTRANAEAIAAAQLTAEQPTAELLAMALPLQIEQQKNKPTDDYDD